MGDASELRRRFDALARAYPPGQHGRWAAHERSNALDGWFVDAIDRSGHVAVVALGGYGRRLQMPCSDVDVLVIHDGLDEATLEELGRLLWYPLWDRGFTVTPLVRTPEECVEAAAQRLDSCTAMLDARRLAGPEALVRRAIEPVRDAVRSDPAGFAARLMVERDRRGERAGSCAHDLAPDLKDGFGGEITGVGLQSKVYSIPEFLQMVIDGDFTSEKWKSWMALSPLGCWTKCHR